MNKFENHYEYVEYVSPYSILVVTGDGELIEVNCPFKVKAKATFPEIEADTITWVQMVQSTKERKDVFIIGENAYLIGYFQIILE